MKRLIIALISVAFFFAACQQAQNAKHVHEDGASHEDCSEDHSTAGHPPQETFEVNADTTGGQMHHEGETGHNHGANGHDNHSH